MSDTDTRIIRTEHLFRPLHVELIALLERLGPAEWDRPTVAGEWRVRDVVAHLVDGDLRRLSTHRDRHIGPPPSSPIDGYDALVAHLNELNRQWVVAARRLSRAVLLSLARWSGEEVAGFVETLDPLAAAPFPVAWAGEAESRNWMDIGRDYTERWHHQQQIRLAVGAMLLLGERWARPLFEISVRALPRAYAGTPAPEGTVVRITIEGEGGGSWSLVRAESGWSLRAHGSPDQPSAAPETSIRLPADLAWRILYNAPYDDAAGPAVDGNAELARPLLAARSVMV